MAVQPSAGPAALWPAYIGRMPDGKQTATNLIVVYDTEPRQDGRLMRTGERIEHPGLQFRVRAVDYLTGHKKLAIIAAALDVIKRQTVTVDGTAYLIHAIKRIGGIIQLGTDEVGREGFTFNATATISEAP